MQGIYVDNKRPTSKKAIKEAMADNPRRVRIEATSVQGNEYGGRLIDAPVGTRINFVGPDPYTKRSFYGTILVTPTGFKVT